MTLARGPKPALPLSMQRWLIKNSLIASEHAHRVVMGNDRHDGNHGEARRRARARKRRQIASRSRGRNRWFARQRGRKIR